MHRLQNRPTSVASSRIPSPPQPTTPGSPVFQQRSPSSPDSQTASLYQHLQRLHLHQSNSAPNFRRGSPPNLVQVYSAQRSESPPQTYQNLLQNFPAGHQRSSPPPNFQNLQIIKEDSMDLQEKSSQSDSDEDMHVQEHSAESSSKVAASTSKAFSAKPQISITDTQGYVTAVTSDGDSESEKGEPESKSVTPSPTTTSTQSPFTFSYTLPYSTYVNTNLNNIPAEDLVTSAQNQQHFPQYDPSFANISWNNPQLAYLQRLQGINTSDLGKYRTINNIGEYSDSHGSWEMYNNGIMGLYDTYRDNRSYAGSDTVFSGHTQTSTSTQFGMQAKSSPSLGVDGNSDLKKAGSFVNVSSKRSVTDILHDIRKILDDSGPDIVYTCFENRFQLENSDVAMEVEVMEGIDMNKLQVRRISGDRGHYQQLCQELLAGINI